MNAAMRTASSQRGERGREIELPGLERVQSAAAVPLLARGELTGVLYLESERPGDFGPGKERLLRILGAQLGARSRCWRRIVARARRTSRRRHGPGGSRARSPTTRRTTASSSTAPTSSRGPGRILWKLLREHAADGRTAFTNRELRLDERLGLPPGNDNLEARLLVLRKRLAALECGIPLDRVGRGRLALHLAAAVPREVPTADRCAPLTGPLRAGKQFRSG